MYKYFTRSFNTRFIERIYKQLDFNADDFYSVQVRAIEKKKKNCDTAIPN